MPLSNLNGARLVTSNRVLTAIVTPTAIHRLTRCDLDPKTGGTCQLAAPVPGQFGTVHAAVAAEDGSALWIAAQNGLFVHRSSAAKMPKRVLMTPISAVAAAVNGLIVAGNDAKLWHLNASTTAVMRWEWVTDVQQGWGGVVDDRVTDMAFARDMAAPDLYIGNPTCLNVWSGTRHTYTRVGADEGLPFGNITTVLTTSYRGVTQVQRSLRLWTHTHTYT